jgi:GNAT superfamily N-acetyltransferase
LNSKSDAMIFREGQPGDISQIMVVRFAVKENTLLVTAADCEEYLFHRGKGWVCLENKSVVGFSIVDLKEKNVWALFVHPDFAERGIGKKLHGMMLEWYFDQSNENIWLGTSPNTRAENFYRMQGWKATGVHGKGEIKFEMSYDVFKNNLKK